MQKYFASVVVGGEGELDANSRIFVGHSDSMAQFLATLMMAFDQDGTKLLLLRRAALLDDFEEGDFDAPINLGPVKAMDMQPGRLIAGDPYPGALPQALPESGCKMALVELAVKSGGGQVALVGVKADNAIQGLRIMLSDAEQGGATITSVEGLMDSELHADDAYDFDAKPSALAARVAKGEHIAMSEPIAFGS
ncbi:hypothetical protein SAMN05444273_107206 [Litoreibacter ascidiaceicola]|uniref:Uncharacterized protein n=1 Tax=Litoreibacter ascidiaceicola TaxID=1486859 RepID=A0A1M5CNJ0_9RHOB|nr:hypothetical protein [Litoreibacter ascidiaceicola]SHF56226.1 hypothetical protein SAMN05444273_107206 [Litoreibacter ascidiaceicola]